MKFDIKKVKIVVFVPLKFVKKVRKAACESGAGVIGNYTFCSSSNQVRGTFMPNESANPFIGRNNVMERVLEERIEFVCDVENVKGVVESVRGEHPYEEPVIDIFPLLCEEDF